MALKDALIAELKSEAGKTRKMLEKVPTNKLNWKPHEKSMSLGRLASHIAESLSWVDWTVNNPDFDFSGGKYVAFKGESTEAILQEFDKRVADAITHFEKADDENLSSNWSMRNGDTVYFTMPRKVVLRNWPFNHLYHHRGQLSVYLRLLDVPVPGMYGPSADESM